uniref:BLUF domain-containing protein n=1 Tax=uncultured Sphingomonas sp. TaxID=158754 RepID=UPI0035CA3088
MRRILYVSVGTAPGNAADLSAILQQSRHNNALDGITGLLWSDGKRFVQAIEGPADSVTATFERIRADPRHDAIVVLQDEIITARDFGGWTMAHRRASDSADAADAHMARILVNASDAIRDQFLSLIADVETAPRGESASSERPAI